MFGILQPVEAEGFPGDYFLLLTATAVSVMSSIILAVRGRSIRLTVIDIALVCSFCYFLFRAIWNNIYPCRSTIFQATLIFLLYISLRLALSCAEVTEREICLFILVFCAVQASQGFYQFFIVQGTHRLTGTFLNPGPYSASLAMGLSIICKNDWEGEYVKDRNVKWTLRLFALLLAALLVLTMSRAAWVATIASVGISCWKKWKRWASLLVPMACATGGILYWLKAASANSRFIIWLTSLCSIARHPWLGSGVGSFFHQHALSMEFLTPRTDITLFHDTDVLEFAFNDLLKIGVEQGLLGLALAIGCLCIVLRSLIRNGPLLCVGLTTLLIFSCFSYPFELRPYQLIFALVVAYAAGNEGIRDLCVCKKHARILFMVSCTFFIVMLLPMKTYNDRMLMAKRKYAQSLFMAEPEKTGAFYQLLPLLDESPQFLFDFGKALSKQGKFVESNRILTRGSLISCDPMFYVIQGNNYKDLADYEMAERYYLKAFHILPNRLYPLYCMMRLYEDMDDVKKKRLAAQQVLDFQAKVDSPAIMEMKNYARKIVLQDGQQQFIYHDILN